MGAACCKPEVRVVQHKHKKTLFALKDLKPDNVLLDEKGHAHITDFNIGVHFSERRLLTGVAGSMAYMVLTKRGYSAPVDFWSLGILAPFRGRTNSALTNSILNEPLSWPEDAPGKCSSDGMHAIRGSKRANFDATHELEELLLEENPLKARKRKEGQDLEMIFKVFDYTKAQRRSYYHPATATNAQTTSTGTRATAASTHLSPIPMSRPHTPSDRTGLVSRSGMDVEGQILDGGGMANLGGRGGWKASEIPDRGNASLDLRPGQPTPLRQASTVDGADVGETSANGR
ncbi:hypothetical protein IAR55_000367 [Kwoniella newhampshirensis]|uniref:Protein kinase domain-containing protein n=1 Tax=Kwoniella newhampshirensis TaxID=1651941 RepID=A0AAW0Z6E5_9TREE